MLASTLAKFQGAICASIWAEDLVMAESQSSTRYAEYLLQQAQALVESKALPKDNSLILPHLTTSQLALVGLPISLWGYAERQLLTQKLLQLIGEGVNESEILQELLIWSEILSLMVREAVSPPQLLPQILQNPVSVPLFHQLNKLQFYLKNNFCLSLIVKRLSNQRQPRQTAIALAIYLFITTPGDLATAVKRAQASGYQTPITAALTGALFGAYQGYNKIPLEGRLSLRKEKFCPHPQTIANQLYAAWCGVVQPGNINTQIVASPQILQPRPQLKIISQQHYYD